MPSFRARACHSACTLLLYAAAGAAAVSAQGAVLSTALSSTPVAPGRQFTLEGASVDVTAATDMPEPPSVPLMAAGALMATGLGTREPRGGGSGPERGALGAGRLPRAGGAVQPSFRQRQSALRGPAGAGAGCRIRTGAGRAGLGRERRRRMARRRRGRTAPAVCSRDHAAGTPGRAGPGCFSWYSMNRFRRKNETCANGTCGTRSAARPRPGSPGGDGKLTVLDARKVSLSCTRPDCARE